MRTALDVLLGTDSYKMGHGFMYPADTTHIISYFESRGGGFSDGVEEYNDIVFFGLQYFIKEYLNVRITEDAVKTAALIAEAHGEPFKYKEWMNIAVHNAGRLPLKINALPEGTVTQPHMPLFTVENTVPGYHWLVSYLETELTHVWQPITVASYSHVIRKVVDTFFLRTGTEAETLPFRVHDFGGRGASSRESAMLGGMGHLAAGWLGTDTLAAIHGARNYYSEPCAGFSVIATEHSVMTAYGREHEEDAYREMIDRFGGEGRIVSIVSDTYDLDNVLNNIMPKLKDDVKARGCVPVVRLDSGDPVTTVIMALNSLGNSYGTTLNSKGFKVLDGVRILQGDMIDIVMIRQILAAMEQHGWSVDNIVFGIGGALLQKHNRDTLKFAFKACGMKNDERGLWIPIKKEPKTGAWKTSKGYDELDLSGLITVFDHGYPYNDQTFAQVRERVNETAG